MQVPGTLNDAPREQRPHAESPGTRIDRYHLLKEIGEGGMGTVWLAEQSEPITRQVALKVIKLGMDTREVVQRFEAERQALALMDHPGIAKVLDGGATSTGRPYFVMELVDGVPITEYCDNSRLELRGRLELFARVCEAIQHAHQKGIIHRDIKPSNVLVADQDGEAAPKVIDFGIAKATGAELAQQTMFTQVGQLLGTPEYMAPEQASASGESADIDTRADVYSLGVLLYELLTGTKTFDLKSVLDSGYEELLRTIREVDPVRPSTRVSGLGQSATKIAATRRSEPTTLSRHLRGDVDWIVMKALEKDRERRYETASELALDVHRYLANEPVLAVPPSALYRWRKLVQRRRKTVIAVAVIAILFVAGTIGTGVGYWRTLRANEKLDVSLAAEVTQRELAIRNAERAVEAEAAARTEAERAVEAEAAARTEAERAVDAEALARSEAERAKALEEKARLEADRALEAEALARTEAERATAAEGLALTRMDKLEQVVNFQTTQLGDIDTQQMGARLRDALLDAAGPGARDDLAATLAGINFTNIALDSLETNLFDRTIKAVDAQFANQPQVRAALLQSSANTLVTLGMIEQAVDPQERALALRRAALGNEDPLTVNSIRDTGSLMRERGKLRESETFFTEALELSRRVNGDDHAETLVLMSDMGAVLQDRGRLAESEAIRREAVAGLRRTVGKADERTLSAIFNLGTFLSSTGSPEEAEGFIREGLEGIRALHGDNHPLTLIAINTMGAVMFSLGRQEEAETFLRDAVAASRVVLGDDHFDTLTAIGNLASILRHSGRFEEAEPFFHESVEGHLRVLGEEHPNTIIALANYGGMLKAQGKLDEAEPYYLRALELSRRVNGEMHFDTHGNLADVASLRFSQGREDESKQLYRECLEISRHMLGDDHPDTLLDYYNLGVILRRAGELEEAEEVIVVAFEGRWRVLGPQHERTNDAYRSLRTTYELLIDAARGVGDGNDAEESDAEQLAQSLGNWLAKLGALETRTGNYAEAELVLGEALDVVRRTMPETDARVWQVLGALGASVAAQGRHVEAEMHVVESANRLLELAPDDDAAQRAVQRVVEFYEGWHVVAPGAGHDEPAEQWRR